MTTATVIRNRQPEPDMHAVAVICEIDTYQVTDDGLVVEIKNLTNNRSVYLQDTNAINLRNDLTRLAVACYFLDGSH